MSALSPATRALVQQMTRAPRGPRREGYFALWLAVRVVEDLLLDPPQPERAFRRRVTLLERRMTSLTISPQLRRAIGSVVRHLEDATAADAARILGLLAGPAREVLGQEAAEPLMRAARAARLT